jgi:O-glycosyl hydrolase
MRNPSNLGLPSADKSLGQLTNAAVSNSRVTVTLAAQSVTTFVGGP